MSAWVCASEKSVANYVKIAKLSAFALKFRFLLNGRRNIGITTRNKLISY